MIRKSKVPLKHLTSFQLSGDLSSFISFRSKEDLAAFIRTKEPFCMIGLGSNSLIDPKTTKTFVQLHSQFQSPQVSDNLVLGAGMTVNQLMKFCVKEGITGFEFMAGVPASVGGMVAMNFGCWGIELSSLVKRVFVMDTDGVCHDLSPEEMAFGYRTSCIQTQPLIVLGVELTAQRGASSDIQTLITKNIQTRVAKQPLKDKTFGSIFKNPEKQPAGAVLDQLGYKGKTIGPVTFSAQHANFLVNTGQASYAETVDILHQVQADVKDQSGILLELEVKCLS